MRHTSFKATTSSSRSRSMAAAAAAQCESAALELSVLSWCCTARAGASSYGVISATSRTCKLPGEHVQIQRRALPSPWAQMQTLQDRPSVIRHMQQTMPMSLLSCGSWNCECSTATLRPARHEISERQQVHASSSVDRYMHICLLCRYMALWHAHV